MIRDYFFKSLNKLNPMGLWVNLLLVSVFEALRKGWILIFTFLKYENHVQEGRCIGGISPYRRPVGLRESVSQVWKGIDSSFQNLNHIPKAFYHKHINRSITETQL